jgi:hypothetical protein
MRVVMEINISPGHMLDLDHHMTPDMDHPVMMRTVGTWVEVVASYRMEATRWGHRIDMVVPGKSRR